MSLLRTLLLPALLLCAGTVRAGIPEHSAADPGAAPVTAANLMQSERFWPTRVRLARAWTPPGATRALDAGTRGVLVRVDDPGSARVDFGRHGLHDVPVDTTDVIERANQVRRGELRKRLPNLVWGLGPRLVDASGPTLQAMDLERVYAHAAHLVLLADPKAENFAQLVASIAPLRERPGLLSILLPQGRHRDTWVGRRLQELGWPAAFGLNRMVEPYSEMLLHPGLVPPALLLLSPEGRLLHASPWTPGAVHELLVAVAAALGTPPVESGLTAR